MDQDLFENMGVRDKTEFRRIFNMLLSQCFICRDQNPAEYAFTVRHMDAFQAAFDPAGYILENNQDFRVIALVTPDGFNRYILTKIDSILLLLLRILFDEKSRQLSESQEIRVSIGEVQERFLALKIQNRPLEKTTLNKSLNVLSRYNLIKVLDQSTWNDETEIRIYSSIMMAVRAENIDQTYKRIEAYRMEAGSHNADLGESECVDEDIDAREADQLAQIY